MNLGLHVGDDPQAVIANRERWVDIFHTDLDHTVAGEQVHGSKVAVVGRGEWGRGARRLEDALPDCDGLVTADPGTALISFYADCVPIFLYDPVHGAVGLAHAGWKGTIAGIAQEAVAVMAQAFSSRPQDILAAIGPSIGPCCYEVSEDLGAEFARTFGATVIKGTGKGRPHLDLWKANQENLLRAGVAAANIATAGLCTACHPQLWFSYRHAKGPTGRMGALIVAPGRSCHE